MTTGRPTLALFTVCADDGVLHAINAAVCRHSDVQFAGEFRDYITAGKRPQFSPALNDMAGCIALVDFSRDADAALETVVRLQQSFPGKISIAGIGEKVDAGLLLRSMRSGVAEFLAKPIDAGELDIALQRFSAARLASGHPNRAVGRIVALCGAKGGVGTSLLSVHLATYLVNAGCARTLLVDLKPQLGHAGLFLGMSQTEYHFDELLRNAAKLDTSILSGLVTRHKSGLAVITSPERDFGSDRSRECFAKVLDFLRREYEYVVLDAATELHNAQSAVIAEADEIYAIATPDIAALRDLARLAERLTAAETAAKLRIVVNRSTSTDAVGAEQIEKAVRLPIAISVPNNYVELLHAINDGEPVPPQRRSDFSHAISRWAEQVTGAPVGGRPMQEKRGLFSFLR